VQFSRASRNFSAIYQPGSTNTYELSGTVVDSSAGAYPAQTLSGSFTMIKIASLPAGFSTEDGVHDLYNFPFFEVLAPIGTVSRTATSPSGVEILNKPNLAANCFSHTIGSYTIVTNSRTASGELEHFWAQTNEGESTSILMLKPDNQPNQVQVGVSPGIAIVEAALAAPDGSGQLTIRGTDNVSVDARVTNSSVTNHEISIDLTLP